MISGVDIVLVQKTETNVEHMESFPELVRIPPSLWTLRHEEK